MTARSHTRDAWLYAAITVFAAASIYWVVDPVESSPPDVDYAGGNYAQSIAPTDQKKTASVGNLIGGLERRLEENPDDGKGWLLLARSHDHLGNKAAAWTSYERARELGMIDDALEIKLAAHLLPPASQE